MFGQKAMLRFGQKAVVEIWSKGNVEIWSKGNVEIWSKGNVEIWSKGNVEIWAEFLLVKMQYRVILLQPLTKFPNPLNRQRDPDLAIDVLRYGSTIPDFSPGSA
ncbi:hypothetical protein Tco_0855795 [Tanacetum coccineum]